MQQSLLSLSPLQAVTTFYVLFLHKFVLFSVPFVVTVWLSPDYPALLPDIVLITDWHPVLNTLYLKCCFVPEPDVFCGRTPAHLLTCRGACSFKSVASWAFVLLPQLHFPPNLTAVRECWRRIDPLILQLLHLQENLPQWWKSRGFPPRYSLISLSLHVAHQQQSLFE